MSSPTSTTLPVKSHPDALHLTASVHAYLDSTYPFSSQQTKNAFESQDLPRFTALLYPESQIERLESAALFTSLTAILDDAFSQMSIADARKIGARLLAIMQGATTADDAVPVERILGKVIGDMNVQSPELAGDVLNGAVTLFLAQTDKRRLEVTGLDEYFEFRYGDVGGDFFTALSRFANDIVLSEDEKVKFKGLEKLMIRHVIIANDILSWEKELKEADESNEEGGALCSVVPILARNLGIGFEGAKRVLWVAARELEGEMERVAGGLGPLSEEGERYVQALKYLASGNEEWCRTTSRYRVE
ncbi:uncharacterized protein DSM5745_05053 [Aspergillus mulundensis]|uniref:Terpenoid synthase n=1 Tax=Aspergillus mulundensis TaxID=1810919 RepID=A0A3D8S5H1_9EURO|nr:Uncharacterized protein DSM5745_05053 [Aspergillus mulundensis]RDW81496.1 Uncharacterized protein DSM5745_05053 [Aspergillus mulundensis]